LKRIRSIRKIIL